MNYIDTMKMALEALENALSDDKPYIRKSEAAITALRLAIEQAEKQEPVAGVLPCPFCGDSALGFQDGSTHRWGVAYCAGCGASAGETRREYPDEGKWHEEAIKQWNTRSAPPQRLPVGWLRAVDEEMIGTHLGVADASDTYDQAKKKLNDLICWHVAVATDPTVNGGLELKPQRQPLTEREALEIFEQARAGSVKPVGVLRGIRAIEQAHGITGDK